MQVGSGKGRNCLEISSERRPAPITVPVGIASAFAGACSHNHPSGNPEPSRDIQITARIAEAGRLLGITVHDHVIVGREGHVGLKAKGLI